MRHYHIYLIEDEVAEAYFGDESKLFHLFFEAETATFSEQLETLRKQINYITKPITVNEMDDGLRYALKGRRDYNPAFGRHMISTSDGRSEAELIFSDQQMILMASGTVEAETIFFEALRRQERCLLAMDFHNEQYGWLNPIKQTGLI